MGIWAGTAVDRRLEGLVVARLRRRWPVLRLMPARWIRPVIRPTAVQLRRSLLRGALAAVVAAGIILMVLVRVA